MRIAPFCLLSLLLAASCASAPPPLPEPAPASPAQTVPPVAETPLPVPEPVVLPEPVPAPEPVVEPVFVVTAEKKQTSLAEIKVLVDKLNALIARKSFAEWKTYLDQDYLRTYSDPTKLKEFSTKDPILKQLGIKLKTLEDYFKFEVVPSRADVSVDDISFLDENRVNVYTVVDKERVLLYLLKLYDKEWKISSW